MVRPLSVLSFLSLSGTLPAHAGAGEPPVAVATGMAASSPAVLEDVRLKIAVDPKDPRYARVRAAWTVRALATGEVSFGVPLPEDPAGAEAAAEHLHLEVDRREIRCVAMDAPDGAACVAMLPLEAGRTARIEAVLDVQTVPVAEGWGPRRLRWPMLLGGSWTGAVPRVRIAVDLGAAAGHATIEAPAGADLERPDRPRWDLRHVEPATAGAISLRLDVGDIVRHRVFSTWNTVNPMGAPIVDASSVQVDPEDPRAWDILRSVDGNPDTAWCEGVPGEGVGEWLEVSAREAGPDCRLTGLALTPGLPMNPVRWEAYGRPTRVRVAPCRSGPSIDVDVPAANWRTASVLLDTAGVPPATTCLRLSVLEVGAGARLDQTCIAEVAPMWSCGER